VIAELLVINVRGILSECCESDLCMSVCVSAVSCAVSVIEMVVKNFATLIKTTVSGPPPSNVDIAAEERLVQLSVVIEYSMSATDGLSCWTVAFQNNEQE